MDRRSFILVATRALLAAPLAAFGQQPARVYRIGVLGAATAAQYAQRMDLFRQSLRELGWVNERAIVFEERWADGHYERLPQLAAELVALKVDVILASSGTPTVEAAMGATQEIPIVFPSIGDAVLQKLVASMSHPGGNVTGISNMSTELYAKRVSLVKEAVPGVKHVGLLLNYANSFAAEASRISQSASKSLGIQLEEFDARRPEDFETVFQNMARAGVQALLVGEDNTLQVNLRQIGELALRFRLPFGHYSQ